jgi:homoserine O-acetyltransferase/O-succinyltransferase
MSRAIWLAGLLALALSACAETRSAHPNGNGANANPPDSLESVLSRTFTVPAFKLESGQVLPELTLAYETYGRLALDGRNAILVTHGFTSNHHAAGKYTVTDPTAGWWDGLIGPGKAIDTDRYFVVSSNMLGSSYGSTAPASQNPKTGKPYGPDFPDITLLDIVGAQKVLLEGLGVQHLVAVAGPSYGGYQTFQWAVTYPSFMSGVVPVVSAPKGSGGDASVKALQDRFATDPNWNGGWHYDRGGIFPTLLQLRIETLERYGQNEVLARTIADPEQRSARLRQLAETWARRFDPNSMIVLRKAAVKFDAERDFSRVRAKVLYVLSRTDKIFPPSIAPDVMDKLSRARVDAKYFEIDTELGHSASGPESAKWAPTLKGFIAGLER